MARTIPAQFSLLKVLSFTILFVCYVNIIRTQGRSLGLSIKSVFNGIQCVYKYLKLVLQCTADVKLNEHGNL